ncbi:YceI family protein [Goekera deserti]|uniref:YceI family protein n=1 Tax=Goekera deserti TaxID=2497753 RepID=UPI00192ED955|nr:YceI family protein [Goekera deserti]
MAKHRATEAGATDFDVATSALADVTGDYTVDAAHSRIGVRARHAMVTTVRGAFTRFEGAAHLDTAEPQASTVSLSIDAASVDTGQPDRDAHLVSADFLDVAGHPRITFASTGVEQVDEDVYRVTGDLTIKGVTRSVAVDFTLTGSAQDPFGNLRVGFEGALVIRRSEWGVTWNAALETGGVLVSDKIQIEFDVSAIKNG